LKNAIIIRVIKETAKYSVAGGHNFFNPTISIYYSFRFYMKGLLVSNGCWSNPVIGFPEIISALIREPTEEFVARLDKEFAL